MYVCTSNYEPMPGFPLQHPQTLHVQAPNETTRKLWCHRSLEHMLTAAWGGIAAIEVRLDASPPAVTDMRHLERWQRCVAFATFACVNAVVKAASPYAFGRGASVAVTVTDEPGGKLGLAIQMRLSASTDRVSLPQRLLSSRDGLFFVDGEATPSEALLAYGIAPELHPRLLTIVGMVDSGFLKPGVVVLRGAEAGRATHQTALRALLSSRLGAELQEMAVTALEEGDKKILFGNPDPSNAPLLRFIDHFTNPGAYPGDGNGACVAALRCDGMLAVQSTSATHSCSSRRARTTWASSCCESCWRQTTARCNPAHPRDGAHPSRLALADCPRTDARNPHPQESRDVPRQCGGSVRWRGVHTPPFTPLFALAGWSRSWSRGPTRSSRADDRAGHLHKTLQLAERATIPEGRGHDSCAMIQPPFRRVGRCSPLHNPRQTQKPEGRLPDALQTT